LGKIYCITGKSGTGKDTLLDSILNDIAIDIIPVITYTTRPKRKNETDGIQYYFVNEDKLISLENQNKIIEKRTYETVHGKWSYFTVDFNPNFQENYILITTLEALDQIIKWYGKENIKLVYLEIDDKKRLERCIHRESQQKSPNFSEVCRRYLADEKDFSKENLKKYLDIMIKINTDSDLENSKNILKNNLL